MKIMVGRLFNAGDRIQHYNPIEENDMRYFDRKNPVSLQDEIIFNIIYYFGQRGRERIRQLQKEDFIIGLSSDGSNFEVCGDTDGFGIEKCETIFKKRNFCLM